MGELSEFNVKNEGYSYVNSWGILKIEKSNSGLGGIWRSLLSKY